MLDSALIPLSGMPFAGAIVDANEAGHDVHARARQLPSGGLALPDSRDRPYIGQLRLCAAFTNSSWPRVSRRLSCGPLPRHYVRDYSRGVAARLVAPCRLPEQRRARGVLAELPALW